MRATGIAGLAIAAACTSPRGPGVGPDSASSIDAPIVDGTRADSGGDGAPGPDAAPPATCTGAGFAAVPIHWPLPAGYPARSFWTDGSGSCAGGSPAYLLIDLDGDRAPELVVTSRCDQGPVGTSQWLAYANGGARFATTGTAWTLPPGYPARSFWSASSDTCGTTAGPRYFLADLDGDLRPDLVVPSACDGSTLGSDHWLVYRNTGTGFAAAATTWPLPAGYAAHAFDHARADACGAGAGPIFALVDLDGDHRPELVVTSRCDASTVGTTRWLAYANTGAGFAASGADWPLPPGYAARAFWTPSNDTCATTGPQYFVADLDGDLRPELVVPFACDASSVGTDRWRVYPNTGTGFAAAATDWALPPGYGDRAFAARGRDSCAASPRFTLADLDGDRRPDLVVTSACDDSPVGTTWWLEHANTGTGFAAAATAWCLPPGYDERAFWSASNASCAATAPLYALDDLDGDQAPELVVTSRCANDVVGTSEWLAY